MATKVTYRSATLSDVDESDQLRLVKSAQLSDVVVAAGWLSNVAQLSTALSEALTTEEDGVVLLQGHSSLTMGVISIGISSNLAQSAVG